MDSEITVGIGLGIVSGNRSTLLMRFLVVDGIEEREEGNMSVVG
jgi:hypothetical protein